MSSALLLTTRSPSCICALWQRWPFSTAWGRGKRGAQSWLEGGKRGKGASSVLVLREEAPWLEAAQLSADWPVGRDEGVVRRPLQLNPAQPSALPWQPAPAYWAEGVDFTHHLLPTPGCFRRTQVPTPTDTHPATLGSAGQGPVESQEGTLEALHGSDGKSEYREDRAVAATGKAMLFFPFFKEKVSITQAGV